MRAEQYYNQGASYIVTMSNLTTVIPSTKMNSTSEPLPSNFHVLLGVWLFVLVCMFVMAVATVVVNGLTLFAIYKDPLKCFRNPLAIFVTGVITADFLTGLVGEPIMASGIAHTWRAEEENERTTGVYVLFIGLVAASITMTVSFLILLALAISQLLAIGWPRRYERCVSVFKAKLGIALIWVFTLVVGITFAVLSWWILIGLTILEVGLMTIALVVLYLVSFCVFRSRIGRHDSGQNEVINKEFLRGTFFLVLVQIVTVWPYIAFCLAAPIAGHNNPQVWVNLEIASSISSVLFLAKFLIDPVILVWRLPKYRKAMKIVYESCLTRCGCAGGETATEARAAYAETRHEDFDENSHEDDKVNVEVIQ